MVSKSLQLFSFTLLFLLMFQAIFADLKPETHIDDDDQTAMRCPRHHQRNVEDAVRQKTIHIGSYCVALFVFPNEPKWLASKYNLTCAFLPGTRADAFNPVSRAFETWAENTHFRFTMTEDYVNAEIKISFESGNHGDGASFDGPGGTLAHAFAPTVGRFHYDADESWSVIPNPGAYHLETLALHEIGHLLGLEHSSIEGAIMYPTFRHGESKGLHGDDIQGIKAL